MSSSPNYQSYLLRLWRDNTRTGWQASLQSTATERIYHFADVEQMWAFLQAQLAAGGDDAEAGDTPPNALERGAPD